MLIVSGALWGRMTKYNWSLMPRGIDVEGDVASGNSDKYEMANIFGLLTCESVWTGHHRLHQDVFVLPIH
jgi:hypothetical protein